MSVPEPPSIGVQNNLASLQAPPRLQMVNPYAIAELKERTSLLPDEFAARVDTSLPDWVHHARLGQRGGGWLLRLTVRGEQRLSDILSIQKTFSQALQSPIRLSVEMLLPEKHLKRMLVIGERVTLDRLFAYNVKTAASGKGKELEHKRAVREAFQKEGILISSIRFGQLRKGQNGDGKFCVVQTYVPEGREKGVERVLKHLREYFGLEVLLAEHRIIPSQKKILADLAVDGLIVDQGKVQERVRALKGWQSNGRLAQVPHPSNLVDLRDRRFFAVDQPGTRDRDDAIAVEELSDGRKRMTVAFADTTWLVKRGSRVEKESLRRGPSLYGRKHRIGFMDESVVSRTSLDPGGERPVWFVEFTFQDGELLPNARWGRGCIAGATALSFEEVNEVLNDPHHGSHEPLSALQELVTVLRSKRLAKSPFEFLEYESWGQVIVEEAMVAAKVKIGELLERARVPALYRVHRLPTKKTIQNLLSRLHRTGFEVEAEDILEVDKFVSLVRKLEAKGELPLASELIHAHLGKASWSTVNSGHYALGQQVYTEIKALRVPGGYINSLKLQEIWRTLCAATKGEVVQQPPLVELPEELQKVVQSMQRNAERRARKSRNSYRGVVTAKEMHKYQRYVTRKDKAQADRYLRLLTLERIEQGLEHFGKELSGTVRRVKDTNVLVEVPELERWAFVRRETAAFSLFGDRWREGSQVPLRMKGFSVEKMRFEFEVEKGPAVTFGGRVKAWMKETFKRFNLPGRSRSFS